MMENLSFDELRELKGGDFWDGLATAFYYTYKYSSVSAALITGIVEGYYEEKKK